MPVRLLLLVSGIMWVTVGSAGRPAGRRVGLRAGSGQHFRIFAGPRAGSGHEFFYRVFFRSDPNPTQPEKCPGIEEVHGSSLSPAAPRSRHRNSRTCVQFYHGKRSVEPWRKPVPVLMMAGEVRSRRRLVPMEFWIMGLARATQIGLA